MSRFHNRNFELLEPYDAKVSCTVLRGESIRKDADLLDKNLFSLDNLKTVDPEQLGAAYPSVRSYWAGVKFNF